VKEQAEYGYSESTGNDWRQGMGNSERNPERGKRTVTPGQGGTRNQRNIWSLGPESYDGAHFATFPTEIPRRAILAGTSAKGCCPQCLAPWGRIVERGAPDLDRTVAWDQTCACPLTLPIPCTVLDPFAGSGTTGRVCRELGREFIGIELNPAYIALAEARIAAPFTAEGEAQADREAAGQARLW